MNSPVDNGSACRCVGCGSEELTPFFELPHVPVHVGMLHDDHQSALQAPMGAIELVYCHHCDLAYNRQFDPNKTCFSPGYEVALHHSAIFREYIESVVERLVEDYQLTDKRIFEIGCGDGYFLSRLCERGGNQGLGIDPTVKEEITRTAGEGSVEFIRDIFTSRFKDHVCDFICCLSVFEDIPQPLEFLRNVSHMAAERQIPIYFEVFNAMRAFEDKETWSIHYEQCNYFSLASLTSLFRRAGFTPLKSGTCYESGQYLFVDAVANAPPDETTGDSPAELPPAIAEFSRHYQETKTYWQNTLQELKASGKRVVLWGSGGKGVSFLNAIQTDAIEYVVEINPDKCGKFIPGSGQQIMPISFLSDYQPDLVIITNQLYKNEMQQQAESLGVFTEFSVA